MAQKNNRYIQFYTPGSTAVKVEVHDEQAWAPLPQQQKQTRRVVRIDPVALLGFVVAVCMLAMMTVGIQQLNHTRQEVAALEHYVAELTAENYALTETYHNGYRIEDIRRKAEDMGMVPAEEATQTRIYITLPPQPQAPDTLWEKITAFAEGLFA